MPAHATKRRRSNGTSGPVYKKRHVNGYAAPRQRAATMTETKYFDCGISADITTAGTDWSGTEVPCDNFVNGSGATAAYTDSCLLPTAIGNAYGQVNGNRFKMKKIRVRGDLTVVTLADQADIPQPTMCRLMLVMDEQPNGAQAQGESIMQDYGAIAENVYSYKSVASNSGRFRILKDEIVNLSPTAAGTDGTNTNSIAMGTHQFSFQYVPNTAKLVNIASGSATPTIASTVDCNVFLLCFGQRGGAAVAVHVSAASRCYYID